MAVTLVFSAWVTLGRRVDGEESLSQGAAGGMEAMGLGCLTRSPIAGCRCDVGGALGAELWLRPVLTMCRPTPRSSTCSEWVPCPRLGQQFVHWLLPGDTGVGWGQYLSALTALLWPGLLRTTISDLHHLRLELEEAATPEGHAVRFGFPGSRTSAGGLMHR